MGTIFRWTSPVFHTRKPETARQFATEASPKETIFREQTGKCESKVAVKYLAEIPRVVKSPSEPQTQHEIEQKRELV